LTGATESTSQPTPQIAMPVTRLGPGPKRRLIRLPKTLARMVPTPIAV
jgi:hypothetical protein